MPTCRVVIADALRALKAVSPGEEADADQLAVALEALQNLILELHDARGPMVDVDVSANVVANENQRLRIQAGATAQVTLPNAVPLYDGFDPYDYGFNPASDDWAWYPQGLTAPADGILSRQPLDGSRIEIVGTTNGLYFFRADTNAWMPAYGLTTDTEIPLNARYAGPLGALLAERLMESLAVNQPSPGLLRRIGQARRALLFQAGSQRPPVRGQYF